MHHEKPQTLSVHVYIRLSEFDNEEQHTPFCGWVNMQSKGRSLCTNVCVLEDLSTALLMCLLWCICEVFVKNKAKTKLKKQTNKIDTTNKIEILYHPIAFPIEVENI